ncbi:helix-turn-helix domain-containing protein [Pimelobacter simplex]|uniref:helix-turn-helix domain-containing protein n=1 Tax=Nocardioides simplex TaxID=2045 RepID=UPI00130E3284|nr:helix-turn-helix transcriptional regulator [Pimelobacter simplex]MCG8152579.1 helix-turn-helix domain-containing protein [Pimelobacter simplex]
MHQEQVGVGEADDDAAKRANRRFGDRVKTARESVGLTQRGLAERIQADYGLTIDPSAITRIEKGDRSARTAEISAIAGALDTTVAMLFGESRTSSLRDLRDEADRSMRAARRDLSVWLSTLSTIRHILRIHPGLIAEMGSASVPGPESPEDYLSWVRQRLQDIVRDWDPVLAPTEEDAQALRKIGASLLGHLVRVDPLAFPMPPATWDDEGGGDGDGESAEA